jgi:hypothetical protein
MSLCSYNCANSYLLDSFSLWVNKRTFYSLRKRFSSTIFHRLLFVYCSFCSSPEDSAAGSSGAFDLCDFYDLAMETWLSLRRSVFFWVVDGVLRILVNSIRMISLIPSLNF